MGNLAKTNHERGRHAEALTIFESLLCVYQRSLSEIHLGKGDYSLRSVALIGKAAAAMDNLAMMYLQLGRHADALAMGEKALAFVRRVQPENYPTICKVESCGDA